MSDNVNLRLTENHLEIISFFSKITEDQIVKFTVWQREEDRANPGLVSFVGFDIEENVLEFAFVDKMFTINPELEIFFLHQDKRLLFKSKYLSNEKRIIKVKLPRKMRVEEKRQYPRTYLKYEDSHEIEVHFKSKDLRDFNINAALINISDGGVCFVVTKETLSVIDIGKQFSLQYMYKMKQTNGQGVIRNARLFRKKTMKGDELFALGVEFIEKEVKDK